MLRRGYLLLLIVCLSSCATYYQRNAEFNRQFQQGNLPLADKALDNDKRAEKRNTRFLYFVNKGVVAFMEGEYELSNQFFEKAYILSLIHI